MDVALPNNGASGVETQARRDRRLHPRSASHQSQRVATAAFSSLPRHPPQLLHRAVGRIQVDVAKRGDARRAPVQLAVDRGK